MKMVRSFKQISAKYSYTQFHTWQAMTEIAYRHPFLNRHEL